MNRGMNFGCWLTFHSPFSFASQIFTCFAKILYFTKQLIVIGFFFVIVHNYNINFK